MKRKRGLSLDSPEYVARDMTTLLDRRWRNSRYRRPVAGHRSQIANDEHLGMAWHAQVRLDANSTDTVKRHAQARTKGGSLDPGRPENRVASNYFFAKHH